MMYCRKRNCPKWVLSNLLVAVSMSKSVTVSKWDTAEFLESQEDIDAYLQVAFERDCIIYRNDVCESRT